MTQDNLLLGLERDTVGHHTFVGYRPEVSDRNELCVVDFSIVNEWTRQGTHWFLVHNNSDNPVPSIGVTLRSASTESPSIGYDHRPDNEVAGTIEPLLAREYRYLPGSLWWKTFGHLLEDLTVDSFEIGEQALNPRSSPSSSDHEIHPMYLELFSRRVPLQVLGLYINGGIATVKVQNQSDLRLFQADVELTIHLHRDGSRNQKMFVCRERSSTATQWLEPTQIVEVQFFVDDDVDRTVVEGYMISSFAYRRRRETEQESPSSSGRGLAFGPGGGIFQTTTADVNAKFDFGPIDQRLQTIGESLEREGRWQFRWASRGFLSVRCRSCHHDYEVFHSRALDGDEIWCSRCAAESNVVEYVRFEDKDKYRTRTKQTPESVEVTFPKHLRQRMDVRCLLCAAVEEVPFEALTARKWTCPHCRGNEKWVAACSEALRHQEVLRAISVQKQRDIEAQRNRPQGTTATIAQKAGFWFGKRNR